MKQNWKSIFFIMIVILFANSASFAISEEDYSIGKAIVKSVFYLIITMTVLIATVYGTKFIAKNSKKFVSSKYMQVIDSLNLGVNTKILIIEINEAIYIFAVSNNTVDLVDKLSKEEFSKERSFEDQLNRYKYNYGKQHENFNKVMANIKKTLKKSNKFIDKEDE